MNLFTEQRQTHRCGEQSCGCQWGRRGEGNGQIRSFGLTCTHCYGLPWWLGSKESACQYRRCGFNPWVKKIHWRRKWQPTPVFLPGKSHAQRSLAGHSPQGRRVGLNWVTNTDFSHLTNRETEVQRRYIDSQSPELARGSWNLSTADRLSADSALVPTALRLAGHTQLFTVKKFLKPDVCRAEETSQD